MSRPELSVVVVSYRCSEVLDECLTSLNANRADVDMEVEVVDNASGDDTADMSRRHAWVTTTALDENLGFAKANNQAMDRARGRAVLVLNPDTVVPPGALRACLDELWRNPSVGLLTPRLVEGAQTQNHHPVVTLVLHAHGVRGRLTLRVGRQGIERRVLGHRQILKWHAPVLLTRERDHHARTRRRPEHALQHAARTLHIHLPCAGWITERLAHRCDACQMEDGVGRHIGHHSSHGIGIGIGDVDGGTGGTRRRRLVHGREEGAMHIPAVAKER